MQLFNLCWKLLGAAETLERDKVSLAFDLSKNQRSQRIHNSSDWSYSPNISICLEPPRSLVFQTVQVGPRFSGANCRVFCQPLPKLPGSHCQVSRLSSAGIEKVGMGMGGILVASQLVSKSQKIQNLVVCFWVVCFFFGGEEDGHFKPLILTFRDYFINYLIRIPFINQSIDWCAIFFFKLLTWYHDSRVKTNPTEDTFFFLCSFSVMNLVPSI